MKDYSHAYSIICIVFLFKSSPSIASDKLQSDGESCKATCLRTGSQSILVVSSIPTVFTRARI
jgi:hypothetical protein